MIQPIKMNHQCPQKNQFLTEAWYRGVLTCFSLVFFGNKQNFSSLSKMINRFDFLYKRADRGPDSPSEKYQGWSSLKKLLLIKHPEVDEIYRKVCGCALPILQEKDFEQNDSLFMARPGSSNPFEDPQDPDDLFSKGRNMTLSTRLAETVNTSAYSQAILTQPPMDFARKPAEPQRTSATAARITPPPGLSIGNLVV